MVQKRTITTLLYFLITLTVLAGCSGNGTNDSNTVPTPALAPSANDNAVTPAPSTNDNNADTAAKELFTLNATTNIDFMEFYIADELGFFEEEGIKINYIGAVPSGGNAFQLLEQGEIDVIYSGHPSNVANAILAGVDVKMVQPGMLDSKESPHVVYLVKDDSAIQSWADLKGAKVAISAEAPCTDGYVRYQLIKAGLDPDTDVEFVAMPESGQMEIAVAAGQIDVTTSHTPQWNIALERGGVRAFSDTYEAFQNPGLGIGSRCLAGRIIRDNPEVAQGFVNAMYRARLWSNDHPKEAEAVHEAVLGLEPGDVVALYQDPNKNIDPKYIEPWVELSETLGYWAPGDISLDDIYTNEFVPADAPESDKTREWNGKVNNTTYNFN